MDGFPLPHFLIFSGWTALGFTHRNWLLLVLRLFHFTLAYHSSSAASSTAYRRRERERLSKKPLSAMRGAICMSSEDTLVCPQMFMDAITDEILATDKNFPEVSIIMPCLNEYRYPCRVHRQSQKSTK
jgi:hypothetical protein